MKSTCEKASDFHVDEGAKQRVLEAVDKRRNFIVDFTADLVRIPSVTPTYPGADYDAELGGERNVKLHLQNVEREIGAETKLVEWIGGDHIQQACAYAYRECLETSRGTSRFSLSATTRGTCKLAHQPF
jgi:hypothetical protein